MIQSTMTTHFSVVGSVEFLYIKAALVLIIYPHCKIGTKLVDIARYLL